MKKKGRNTMTIEIVRSLRWLAVLLVVLTPLGAWAAHKVEKGPSREGRAESPATAEAPLSLIQQFGPRPQAYRKFMDGNFRVTHRPPTAAAPFFTIELAAPALEGFGGACIERIGPPVDLGRYRYMDLDIDVSEPTNQVQIKLERRTSTSDGDAQFRAHDGSFPHAGRQTVTLPLEGSASVIRQVQRLCIAMEASGFNVTPARGTIKVHRVQFR
jgi:hypothetical protein